MRRNSPIVLLPLVLSLFSFHLLASDSSKAEERRLLGLVDYISSDYPGAVSDGNVKSESEYAEMKEFVQTAKEISKGLSSKLSRESSATVTEGLKNLEVCILNKCKHENLLEITRALHKHFVVDFGIRSAPSKRPDFQMGKKVFAETCASCHGNTGKGDGPAAVALKLNPSPRSFQDSDYLKQASPFKFVNTLYTGIKDTAMVSYENTLSEEQMWSVSFYLMGLRFGKEATVEEASREWERRLKKNPSSLPSDLGFLASSSDADLKAEDLVFLRSLAPYAEQLSVQKSVSSNFPWDYIQEQIDRSQKQFDAKSYNEASGALLDAYLGGFEKIEASLAVADHELLLTIERTYSVARSYASKGDEKEFRAIVPELKRLTEEAHSKLTRKKESGWSFGEFLSSLVIILREGFEAFLIIVALLMIVGNLGSARAKAWIHAGWISAAFFGLASYFVFEKVLMLSGAARETIEAFCTLLATLVLFYTGFWLLSQTEHNKWQKYIKVKTNQALSSQRLWVLFGISFLAVFRESAETVLFYSALLANTETPLVVLSGFLAGIMILLVICTAIMKFHVRLPLKQFFMATSSFMVFLSIVLAGKTVHELIAAGYLKATPLNILPMIDILGLYPLQETVFAQVLLIGITVFILLRKRCSAS